MTARAVGDRVNESVSLHNLSWLALVQEDYSAAHALSEASLVVGRAVGDAWIVGISLGTFGRVALCQGDLVTARRFADEALAVQRRIGERNILARSLELLGLVAMAEGDYAGAHAALGESLQLYEEMGDCAGVADTLDSIAALAATETQSDRAVQLVGEAASIRGQIGAALSPMRRAMLDHWLVPLTQAVGAERTRLAWETGCDMAFEQALELALAALEAPATRSNGPPDRPAQQVAGLSPREREVAALLALGLSNRQIAQRLVVTERTVGAHIEHILDKLGFASRHQVGVWANEHGLIG